MLNLFQHPLLKCTHKGIAGQARNDGLVENIILEVPLCY